MDKIIKNLLRTKGVQYYTGNKMDLDDDYVRDYCIARDLNYRAVHTELESRGYNLI